MSRIGKKPIIIPETVNVKMEEGKVVVTGPKGELEISIPGKIKVEEKEKEILVQRLSDQKKVRALHGTLRQLIANAVLGVTAGWEKSLEVVGTGFRAAKEDNKLVLSVGFSHKVVIVPPEGIEIDLQGQNIIRVKGIDKALVGRVAAQIREIRPPDPYKGKGIRYLGEEIKLKPGKAVTGERTAGK